MCLEQTEFRFCL